MFSLRLDLISNELWPQTRVFWEIFPGLPRNNGEKRKPWQQSQGFEIELA